LVFDGLIWARHFFFILHRTYLCDEEIRSTYVGRSEITHEEKHDTVLLYFKGTNNIPATERFVRKVEEPKKPKKPRFARRPSNAGFDPGIRRKIYVEAVP
jgi:hypothetical protein